MKGGYGEVLDNLRRTGRLRVFHPLSGREGCLIDYEGRRMLNLTSNDYLGLAGDARLLARFYGQTDDLRSLDHFGLGAASSRLLTGDSPNTHLLEQLLAEVYGRPAVLLYNSGYHANIGILPALAGKGDLILSDRLNHASLHDGLRLSQAEHRRYRHGDYHQLEELLAKMRGEHERIFLVSESVFSMDGDIADLKRLVELKNRYRCLLYIDEAHAVGLYGRNGLGQAEEQGVVDQIDLLVGTFGKAFASIGAYVVCSEETRDYLINHSRSLIFTTALPPVVISWNIFILKHMLGLHRQRQELRVLSEGLRADLRRCGLQTGGETNIVPVRIGEDTTAVRLAEEMRQHGYLIFPVRPPAVPEGTARFRLSLTAGMHAQDLAGLAEAISEGLRRLTSSSAVD